jgi:Tfp pilus assembly protein PilF
METMSRRRFFAILWILLVAGFAVRAAYVVAQPASDPNFDRPMLDGEYYVEWARALMAGDGGPSGAYYLAPLYPFFLAGFLALFGANYGFLYLLQQGLVVASAGCLAVAGRRFVGEGAGLAAGSLLLLYHPSLFFASRPLGEPLALFLLSLAMAVYARAEADARAGGLAGLFCGLAALARPNLLAVPVIWALGEGARRRWARAALIVAGVGLAVLPVTVRNAWVSGHFAPISSNMGITLCHGNGPEARGTYTRLDGFSGSLKDQRYEATVLASANVGRRLDPVEADRWWGRHAVRTRLREPAGTGVLFARKLALLVADAELSLDYNPALDRNGWRRAAPLPFAAILGLALAGLLWLRVKGSGGWTAWGAVLACALAPWVFYVSSRYRWPAVAMLCIPAGAAVVALLSGNHQGMTWKRRVGIGITALVLALGSVWMPTGRAESSGEAVALSNRANAWRQSGRLDQSERDLREAVAKDPTLAHPWFALGGVMDARGRSAEAETMYRRALGLQPGHIGAAANLGRILVESGRSREAVPILRRAVTESPYARVCWTNLAVALAAHGEVAEARAVVREAIGFGVSIKPELLEAVGLTTPGPGEAGSPEELPGEE